MSDVSISVLRPDQAHEWDAFVYRTPSGTFFHLSGWRNVIEKAFARDTYYLLAKRDGDVVGVLPLAHIKSAIFGNSLIGNAFTVGGGILSSDFEAEQALRRHAVEVGRHLKVDGIELRSDNSAQFPWQRKSGLYVSFKRPLSASVEENMKAIPRKQRAMVRKGISNGLKAERDETVDRFYEMFARSLHYLGTPVFSKRYFQLLKQQFGSACDIVTIVNGSKPVASVMNFYFRDEVLPYYGGGTAEARGLAANDFMYWEVMRSACERGYRTFDFGRSKIGTGSYDFKCHWGFEPVSMTYEFLPLERVKLPENNPLNPKYKLLVAAWRRLPFYTTKLIGPLIVRSIG